MDRNEYGRQVSHWFEYAARCLQGVGWLDIELAAWEAYGGMRTDLLAQFTPDELAAMMRGRVLAVEAWKARNGLETRSLPALRHGRDD